MGLVIYSDFGSPAGYLASRRVDALAAAGVRVDWRAVEMHPRAPVGAAPLGGAEREALERELTAMGDLQIPGEELAWSLPAFGINTRGAVAGYAEAWGAGVADDVRRLLVAAYWERGLDIGNPEVLRRLLVGPILRGHSTSVPLGEFGLAVSPSRGPITMGAFRRIREWSSQWQAHAAAIPPLAPALGLVLVVDGSLPVSGETALRRLEKEIDRAGAALDPALPDPGRFPPVVDAPDLPWISANGGHQRHAWMVPA